MFFLVSMERIFQCSGTSMEIPYCSLSVVKRPSAGTLFVASMREAAVPADKKTCDQRLSNSLALLWQIVILGILKRQIP